MEFRGLQNRPDGRPGPHSNPFPSPREVLEAPLAALARAELPHGEKAPLVHRSNYGFQALTHRRQDVFDSQRFDLVHSLLDQSPPLELPKFERKGLSADSIHLA